MPNNPTAKTIGKAWENLERHYASIKDTHIANLFEGDKQRFEKFHIECDGLLLDYSKNLITEETLQQLITLAETTDIEHFRDDMFAGARLNITENRATLHTALRGGADDKLNIDGEDVNTFVNNTLEAIKNLSDSIRNDNATTDIIHLGIGGSILGSEMVCTALRQHASGPDIHFIANIDPVPLKNLLERLDPQKTKVIIASKTFTTLETIKNAATIKSWLNDTARLIAITENKEKAKDFGVSKTNILPMRSWIGGRFSLWSSIGLPIALAVGFEQFKALLAGAQTMDQHFKNAPLDKNIPVILALLGIWYRNICDFEAHAIIPYAQDLEKLPAFIQQLDMESNGKAAAYKTGPVIFGDTGTNSQHAFFQLLHQSHTIIPVDFIAFSASATDGDFKEHQEILLSSALAQSQALMQGRSNPEEPHKHFDGNRPSNTLLLRTLDPYHLGMLIALYEHKIIIQGCIWGINSFDQWGVELGKHLAENIRQSLVSGDYIAQDSSTAGLLQHIEKQKNS